MSKGKVVTNEAKQFVINFFEDDNISRQCPGKKDCISVLEENGVKRLKQKRLVLGNLKELFEEFKKLDDCPDRVFNFLLTQTKTLCFGREFRTHSVCICTYHQNPVLQLNAIGEPNLQLTDVMGKAVCDINNEACMMRKYNQCPAEQGVIDFIKNLPSMEDKDELRYKKWVSVDRCMLQDTVEPVDQFLGTFSLAVVQLLRHHFGAKKQGHAFKRSKETLHNYHGVLVGDFAKNYSFLVQDSIGTILSAHCIHGSFTTKPRMDPFSTRVFASYQI